VTNAAVALRVICIAAVCGALIWSAAVLVRRAKRGGKGVQAMGAAMMVLFSWGVMRDPRNDTVAEAQDGRLRRGSESGDPPG
jgi:membrane protein involved in colicin uptake